jgi:hypothetical protein
VILDFDSQLQVSLRALQDVVAPALAGAEKHAVEQLMLVIVTLGFVKTRLPEARRFYRLELRNWIGLARDVAAISDTKDGLTSAIESAETVLSDPEMDLVDFERASRQLREVVTAASSDAVGKPNGESLDAAILDKHGEMLAQSRQWCLPFGFELQPELLPKPAW